MLELVVGADHGGFTLKELCKGKLVGDPRVHVTDMGVESLGSADYPLVAHKVAAAVSSGQFHRGLLICGTGIGMSVVANRYRGVRAALCHELFTARMARLHNDANILVMGGRVIGDALALEMVDVFLNTPFEGGRHSRRLAQIE